jgi:hypothetical protein
MVEHALRGNENAKQKWRETVVQGWFDDTDEPVSAFLSRANKFLRDPEHSIKTMSIFESLEETQSYVVFLKMTGLAASLLFGYFEARKLEFASAGAAGGGTPPLYGFTSFVSSEGHAFCLKKTGVPASHVIVQGLQSMVHLAHTCWDLMGPVKTAQVFRLSKEHNRSMKEENIESRMEKHVCPQFPPYADERAVDPADFLNPSGDPRLPFSLLQQEIRDHFMGDDRPQVSCQRLRGGI